MIISDCVSQMKKVWPLDNFTNTSNSKMDGGGNNINEESFSKRLEQDTSQEFMISSSHIQHSNPTNYHPTSLNLSIPVRQLYHEQAKSIIAIQVSQKSIS